MKQKQGDLNLSINAIVVLILAITLFGIGLAFMRDTFSVEFQKRANEGGTCTTDYEVACLDWEVQHPELRQVYHTRQPNGMFECCGFLEDNQTFTTFTKQCAYILSQRRSVKYLNMSRTQCNVEGGVWQRSDEEKERDQSP